MASLATRRVTPNPHRDPNGIALAGAALELLFAAGLGALLIAATSSQVDAVQRPLVIFGLFAAPGVIGVLGALANRRSVLFGAALPLLPGAMLSWSGVTLAFVIPGLLMVVGAIMRPPQPSPPVRVVGVVLALVLAVLLTAAGVASLLWLTANTCAQTVQPVGTECTSSAITVEGVLVGGALAGTALGIALAATVPHLRKSRRD